MLTAPKKEERYWKTGLFDCMSYRTPRNQSVCIPYFCPMAICGTCCMIGRTVTYLNHENPVCCEMGPIGSLSCLLSNACLGPPGFMITGCFLRQRVIDSYNVRVTGPSDCASAICYPCSYFQMYVSIREWEEEIAHAQSNKPAGKPIIVGETAINPAYNPSYEPPQLR